MNNLARFTPRSKSLFAAVALTALTFTAQAKAAVGGGVDVSGVVSGIEAAAAPIALIGGAVLLILVGIKIYKWVRRAM